MLPGIEASVRGIMTVAYTGRGMCGYLSDQDLRMGRCGQDRVEIATAYRDFLTTMLKEQLKPGDVLALTAASGIALGKSMRQWYDEAVIPMIRSRGARLLLIGEPPALRDLPQVCTPSPTNPNAGEQCESRYGELYKREAWEEAPRNQDDAGESFAKSREDVYFFRSFGLFCTSTEADGVCSGVVPGTDAIAYTDTRHLARAGAVYLAPYLCASFREWGFFA